MALSEPLAVVIGALITGVATGGPAVFIARRRPALRSPRRRGADVWQKQARELDQRLSAQYERQIAYLEAQLEDLRRERNAGSGHD